MRLHLTNIKWDPGGRRLRVGLQGSRASANLMHKMGLHNQSELIRYAIRHGLADALDP